MWQCIRARNFYSYAVRRKSYKMGSVSSFWCHICASKFMLACIYQVILRMRMGPRDYLKYSPVAAKILLLCWENVKKDLRRNPPHVGVTSGQKPSAKIIKPRSHRLGGFLLCLQFIKPRSRRLGGFLLCLRFIIKPRSRRLGGFLLCLRFIFSFFVGNYIQTSADDVIISQLQAISQLFSSYPPSGEFC